MASAPAMHDSSSVLRLILAGLAAVALLGALVLTGLHEDVERVWEAFGAILALLAGQHIPVPTKPEPPG